MKACAAPRSGAGATCPSRSVISNTSCSEFCLFSGCGSITSSRREPRALQRKMDKPPTSALARYASIYGALWKYSVVREMQFKVNFLLWIVVELLWFALQLTFIAVIYSHTDHIGDWTKWQVVFLM